MSARRRRRIGVGVNVLKLAAACPGDARSSKDTITLRSSPVRNHEARNQKSRPRSPYLTAKNQGWRRRHDDLGLRSRSHPAHAVVAPIRDGPSGLFHQGVEGNRPFRNRGGPTRPRGSRPDLGPVPSSVTYVDALTSPGPAGGRSTAHSSSNEASLKAAVWCRPLGR